MWQENISITFLWMRHASGFTSVVKEMRPREISFQPILPENITVRHFRKKISSYLCRCGGSIQRENNKKTYRIKKKHNVRL